MATPFDNKKLALTAKPLPGGSFPPSLKPDIYKGNPQLFVLTGNKKGEGKTFVRAGLEHKTAGLLCQAIEVIASKVINDYHSGVSSSNEENTIATFECKSGKERELVAKVVAGRLKDDSMFISIIDMKDSSAPVIQFVFQPDLYHPVTITGDERLNKALSAMAAKEWAIRTRDYWYIYSINNPAEDQSQGNNNRGNSGGNWQGNSNSNGGGDDDFPWGN